MQRCEDYPCCGHTDGLPCDWTPPAEYPHAGCDHNAGYCQVADEEDDVEERLEEHMPVKTRKITLSLTVEVPVTTGEHEVEEAINSALDEPDLWDESGPYWGDWIVSRAEITAVN